METLTLIGSICSIVSLLIAIFLVDKVVRINNKVNLINTQNISKQTHGNDSSHNVSDVNMDEIKARDIVFGNKKQSE